MNKTTHIEELQQTLQEIFINNLKFFKENYSSIYNKIIAFEKLNIENYSLEFINNEFQLIDLNNNSNFYENNPFSDGINRVNNFNLSSAFSLIKLEPLKKRNHYENEINAYLYLNQYIENFQNINIKIKKFIFIGTLLGIHLNDFHKNLNAQSYLIIEPNIEIFRLSMFMTDYKILATNSKLFFAISENEYNLKQITTKFLKYKYEFNNLIHYELAHKINEPLINQLSIIFTHLGEMRYPFSDYLVSLNRFHNYIIRNKNKLLNLSKNYNFLEKENILFLGAGPSLEKNLDFVSLNRNKFIIVTVAATLKTLESANIIPDIIITVDGQKVVKKQFNVNKFMYENSIILSSIKIDEEVYDILKDTKLYFFQNSLNLFTNFGFITGVTVGDMGIDILLRLGVKNLYLLGIDAAIDSKSGKTHIDTHSSSKKIDLNENLNEINFNKTIVYVKGNFETKVPTFMEYTEMIEEINEKFEQLNNNFKIYNLSNGAYFSNTIPTKTFEINIDKNIDKSYLKEIFLVGLNSLCEGRLEFIYINDFKKEKKVLKKLNSIKKDSFYKEFKTVFENYPNSIVCNILDKFFNLVLPYYNVLKNRNLANEFLEKQISEILNTFNSIF